MRTHFKLIQRHHVHVNIFNVRYFLLQLSRSAYKYMSKLHSPPLKDA